VTAGIRDVEKVIRSGSRYNATCMFFLATFPGSKLHVQKYTSHFARLLPAAQHISRFWTHLRFHRMLILNHPVGDDTRPVCVGNLLQQDVIISNVLKFTISCFSVRLLAQLFCSVPSFYYNKFVPLVSYPLL